MKTTTVIISQSPLTSLRVSEALRMSVGLTLCGDRVRVVFVGDGVYALLHTEPASAGMPEYSRHVETLKQLGHEICAEREALDERGLDRLKTEAKIVPWAEVVRLLLACDSVVRY